MQIGAMVGGGDAASNALWDDVLPDNVNLAPRGGEFDIGLLPPPRGPLKVPIRRPECKSPLVSGGEGVVNPKAATRNNGSPTNGLANVVSDVATNLARNLSFHKQQQLQQQQRQQRVDTGDGSKFSALFDLRRGDDAEKKKSSLDEDAVKPSSGDLIEGFPARRRPSSMTAENYDDDDDDDDDNSDSGRSKGCSGINGSCPSNRMDLLASASSESRRLPQPQQNQPGEGLGGQFELRRNEIISTAPATSGAPMGPWRMGGAAPLRPGGECGGVVGGVSGGSLFDLCRDRGGMRNVSSAGMQREASRTGGGAGGGGSDSGWGDFPASATTSRNHGNAEWGDFAITPPGGAAVGAAAEEGIPPEMLLRRAREAMKLAGQGGSSSSSREKTEELQRATDEAFSSAQSLLQRQQEAMSRQAREIMEQRKDLKRRQRKQHNQWQGKAMQLNNGAGCPQQSPKPTAKMIRDKLAETGEIKDLMNKIKTMDVEIDTRQRVFNSFERPSEMEDGPSHGNPTMYFSASNASLSQNWPATTHQSVSGMRRTTSMYTARSSNPAPGLPANLARSACGGLRIRSEAALHRSRSSSGAVRSILLESRYSNNSMASVSGASSGGSNSTDASTPGMTRPRKRASVKFRAPTIHHIAMQSSLPEEESQTDDSGNIDKKEKRKQKEEAKVENSTSVKSAVTSETGTKPLSPEDTNKKDDKNESSKATDTLAFSPSKKKVTDPQKHQMNNSTSLSSSPSSVDNAKEEEPEVEQAFNMEKIVARDPEKPSVPLTMNDFLSQMNDRTAALQKMRQNGTPDLPRMPSYSEGLCYRSW